MFKMWFVIDIETVGMECFLKSILIIEGKGICANCYFCGYCYRFLEISYW